MIRFVTHDENPVLVNFIKSSFLTVANDFGITQENAPGYVAFAITCDKLYAQLENEHRPMFVYEEAGHICGYYSLALLSNDECELNNLAVLPEYRHHGIGSLLLEHACDTAKSLNFKIMNIGIVEENTVLRQWYEQKGAIHVGVKKYDFSRSPVDF